MALVMVIAAANAQANAQASAPANAQANAPANAQANAQATAPKVLVIGDSLSAGYGLASGQGWVDLLQKKIASSGFAHKVINASISGDTTSGGRSRIGTALTMHKPDVVIIELGGNDGLRGASLKEVRTNVDSMVNAVEKSGAKVLLLGMQIPPNYGTRYVKDFGAVFADAASSRNLPYVPFFLSAFGDKPEMFQPDRLHPTAKAQPLMLDAVWPALSKLLASPSSPSSQTTPSSPSPPSSPSAQTRRPQRSASR